MKHHRLDFFLVVLSLLQVTLMVLPFVMPISSGVLWALGLLNIFLIGTNYQCVAHNFIHHPFFKSSEMNLLFSVLNTLCLGVPQSMYRLHHLNHHRYNNRPEEDESSTFRYGKNGKEENIFIYSFLGVFRTDLKKLYLLAKKNSTQVDLEIITLVVFVLTLLLSNWRLGLMYVIGVYLLGQVFALWENYCEHHHANPNDRKRDSVSCYNSFYNLIWFNNGYHQEHHFAPQVHWTEIQTVTASLPEDRVIVKGCHLFNSF